MTNLWYTVKDHLAQRMSAILGVKVERDDFMRPPKPEMGDVAFGCFEAAKTLNANPAEIAKKAAAEFGSDMRFVEKVEAQGPFVNVTLAPGEFIQRLVLDAEYEGERYASSNAGAGKKIMFEYAQPNTHKEMHVGHVRNLALGSSIVAILRHVGWNVITASYHGDVGAHVAKCLWQFVEQGRASAAEDADAVGATSRLVQAHASRKRKGGKKSTDQKSPVMNLSMYEVRTMIEAIPRERRTGKYLGDLYSQATRELAADPDQKEIVSRVQQALEGDDPVWHKLWQETRRWSLDEFIVLFEEFGVDIERQYLESEVMGEGQKIVDELLKKGVARESEGAIVVDLEDADLGVFLIRKSDGTSLYATKDLALAEFKLEEYPKIERSVMLVDNRQTQYLRQLFETLKRMGYPIPNEHVNYEFVTLKGGAMSSREGNIVTYQDFRDQAYKYAWDQTKARHEAWSQGQVNYTAWSLALAGMKFGMLRQDSDKVYTFDMKEALSFEGDTGPYVQYTAVRLNSILRRADYPDIRGKEEPNCRVLTAPQEKRLALDIARFCEAAARAAQEMRPNIIANWCLETARDANAFYRDLPVLEAESGVREARIRLVYAARDVLTIGLKLLGIPVPEEM
jgi:arginyl-tRNA synthetase